VPLVSVEIAISLTPLVVYYCINSRVRVWYSVLSSLALLYCSSYSTCEYYVVEYYLYYEVVVLVLRER
jgi:hypothetical protein